MTWQDQGNSGVDFTMTYEMGSSTTATWIAVGMSTDDNMADDFVTECVMEGSNNVEIYKSYNPGKFNQRNLNPKLGIVSGSDSGSVNGNILTCQFTLRTAGLGDANNRLEDLNTDYILFFANGPMNADRSAKRAHSFATLPVLSPVAADFQGTQNIGGTTISNALVKAHGCLMIAAWVLCASIGIVLARYYKPIWPARRLLKEKVWFQFHRGLMISALMFVITGFVLIFVHAEGWSDIEGPNVSNFQKAHPFLGVIVTALTIINPVMALFRPHPDDKYRYVFNWAHWLVGLGAHILGVLTIFIGVTLQVASTPFYVVYILAAYTAYQFLIELVLEIHDCCLSGDKARSSAYEMQEVNRAKADDEPSDPEGSKFKKIVIGLHSLIIVAFALTIIIIVAVN